MYLKVSFITIVFLFGITLQTNLLQDPRSHIYLSPPTLQQGSTLSLRFSFPPTSRGIGYNQYFGVAFPESLKAEFSFDTNGGPYYSCSLSEGTNSISVTAVSPVTSEFDPNLIAEKNIAYCRLDDTNYRYTPLSIGYDRIYTLSITFQNAFTSSYVNSVSLFTSTSNKADKIIIDSLALFGTLARYGDYKNFTPKDLDITFSQTYVTRGSSITNTIYPYNAFDVTLNISCNSFLNAADHLIVFKFPKEIVNAPSAVESKDISTVDVKLGGELFLRSLGDGMFYIDGVTENLIPGRKFQLVLSGWSALDTNTSDTKDLDLMVMYKNTHTVTSYVSVNLFNINPATLTLTSSHPESWDIWRNGAWPFTFTIRSNSNLSNGGYLMIEHSNPQGNAATTGNRFTFLASTCDFSNTLGINNTLGRRPTCFPLRNDHNYPTTSTGSGIFFKMPFIQHSTTYTMTVWLYADNCGGDNYNVNSSTSAYVVPQFKVTLYKNIDATKIAEDRFAGQTVLASSTSSAFSQKCWNNVVNSNGENLNFSISGTANSHSYSDVTITNANSSNGVDLLMFKEITDWQIYSQIRNNGCLGSTCFGVNFGADAAQYIYSSSTSEALDTSSYLVLGTKFTNRNQPIPYYLPYNFSGNGNVLTQGRWVLQIPRQWFTTGDSATSGSGNCYMSMAHSDGTGSNSRTLLYDISNVSVIDKTTNYITPKFNQFDSATNLQSDSSTGPMRIVSVLNNQFTFMATGPTTNTSADLQVGIATTCVRWKATFPVITSIYTAIDIQFQFYLNNNGSTGTPSKNWRFITLYPEGGIINDVAKYSQITSAAYYNHYGFGSSQAQTGICLIEIKGDFLSSTGNSNSNSLLIWLYSSQILETDYEDASATYPAGSLSTALAYGRPSQMPMHNDNLYLKGNQTTSNMSTIFTNTQNSFSNRSSYHFYFGSHVLLSGIGSNTVTGTANDSLYIPYYCPIYSDQGHLVRPIITSWATFSASAPLTMDKLISQGNSSLLNTTAGNKNLGVTPSYSASIGSLRFAPYTDNVNTKLLYVFNGNLTGAGTLTTCTGFSLFINQDIQLDANVSFNFSISNGSVGVYNPQVSKKFYVFGKAYHRFLGHGMGQAATAPSNNMASTTTTDSTQTSTTFITGVLRPAIDVFADSILNKVAFSCASSAANHNNIVTSFNGNDFILDWNPDMTTQWITPSIGYDKPDDVYSNDNAGNLKVAFLAPSNLPMGSNIRFGLDNNGFTSNTICGLMSSGIALTQCVTDNTSRVTCTLPSGGNNFTICCYNVAMNLQVSFSSISVDIPNNNNTYLSSILYNAANTITQWRINTSSITRTLSSAQISKVSFSSHVQQEEAFGKVIFEVTLPREVVRGMRVAVNGDFSLLLIQNVSPRCTASFNDNTNVMNKNDTEDILIDSCTVSMLSNSVSNSIVVTTKNLIYKCSQTFSKTLYISMWPVRLVNYSQNSVSYNISMKFPDGREIADNTVNNTLNNNQSSFSLVKPFVRNQLNSLCPVTSVYPRLPGEFGDYHFEFDLTQNVALLQNESPNELTIFWPHWYYGAALPNLRCRSNGAYVDCSFSDEGILNIRFKNALKAEKIVISVLNVPNPEMKGDTFFACTVNNIQDRTRRVLITGTGKFENGLTMEGVTASGSLRFLNHSTPVTSERIRDTATHNFRIAFDTAVGLTSKTFTISSSPVMYVYFPQEYNLDWYPNAQITARITEYSSDVMNNIRATSTIFPASVTVVANRVTIVFAENSYEFKSNWRYWDVTIDGIPTPINSTDWDVAPITQTTRPYSITLTNTRETVLYRTYSNVNTYSSIPVSPTPSDLVLQWNRGNSFTPDPNLWTVDIVQDVSTSLAINRIKLVPGRFIKTNFAVQENTNINLYPSAVKIKLNDTIFKTSSEEYVVSTSVNELIPFYIGCPCSTVPGQYMLNFAYDGESTLFAPIPPVVASVDDSTLGVITIDNIPNVPSIGVHWVEIFISEPNFDPIKLEFTAPQDALNDVTAKMTTVNIPTYSTGASSYGMQRIFSVFSINSNSSGDLNSQKFVTSDPNKCYTLNTKDITINIQGTLNGNLNSTPPSSLFTYYNSESGPGIVKDKNSLAFVYTPPITPSILTCALICHDNFYPADSVLLNIAAGAPLPENTSTLQYYAGFFMSNNSSHTLLFNNLVRGQRYKMKCVIQSTHTDLTKRATEILTFDTLNGVDNFIPTSTASTECAEFRFQNEPAETVSNHFVNYCQRLFSSSGWSSNGCIVCMNGDMTYSPAGMGISNCKHCYKPGSDTTPIPYYQSTRNNPNNIFSVCAVQHPMCKTDVSRGNRIYKDFIKTFIDDLSTDVLVEQNTGVKNVKVLSETTIDDLTAPDFSTLSFSVNSYNKNGLVQWTHSTNAQPLTCYWQILVQDDPLPTFEQMMRCNGPWCGKLQVYNQINQAGTDPNNLKAFLEETQYIVILGCTNAIPCSRSKTTIGYVGNFMLLTPPTPYYPPAVDSVLPNNGSGMISYGIYLMLLLAVLF